MHTSEKPKFFYGYVIVSAAFVVMTLAFGINYTFGVFLEPLLEEFGWARAVTSGAYSLSTMVAGFLGIFAGRLSDRFGPRVVGTAIGCFLGLGFLLLSQVSAIWQFYLFYGLIVAAGVGSGWPSLAPAVTRWFAGRRGLMTGIVASGIGFGSLTVPPLASWLISVYDWDLAYIIIGLIALVLVMLAAQFLKRDPRQIGQLPYGEDKVKQEGSVSEARGFFLQEAMHTRQFWMVCIIYFCFGFGLHTVMVHIVIHATGLGISATTAAGILATVGGMSTVGRITGGGASDRFGVKPSLVSAFILMSVAFLWLISAGEIWMLYLFGVVFGFAYGNIVALQPLLLGELFGLSSLGSILGTVAFIYTIGGAIGPFLAGYIFDITGLYRLAFIVCAAVSIVNVVLMVVLRPISDEQWQKLEIP
ncbi:MAG: MFS transporter [Chloroflexota bacterium]|nr:MAG: MFS transporter [Chloroflexota bacterium]